MRSILKRVARLASSAVTRLTSGGRSSDAAHTWTSPWAISRGGPLSRGKKTMRMRGLYLCGPPQTSLRAPAGLGCHHPNFLRGKTMSDLNRRELLGALAGAATMLSGAPAALGERQRD